MSITLPNPKSLAKNPTQSELADRAAAMPNSQLTEFGNYNVTARVTARSGGSTYLVTDDPSTTSKQTISRAEHDAMAAMQNEHIAGRDMLLLEGYIGAENSSMRVPSRLYIDASAPNIPAMQQHLYFPPDADWDAEDAFTVIYTPELAAEGYPNDRLIAIDIENWVTRVFNADYFGESKMGGLRMWNEWVYQRGGLAMHAGAKVIPTDERDKLGLIVGLSGTGKTTTTFTSQNESLPVQDDFVALTPGGEVLCTEDGCFAKTFGLDPDAEPIIHGALTRPVAWLENVAVDDDGNVDFFDDSHTANGRGTFELAEIEHFDPRKVGKADFLLILNRSETIVPAVAKMTSVEQAVAYFMLGETKGTSAGGAAEAGKSLRVPGTNPFFLRHDYLQGNRMAELIRSIPYDFEVYALSTGRVGGREDDAESKKIEIAHTSAIVKAIADGTITWTPDPDFGYYVAENVPGVDDVEVLQPARFYEARGRGDEYAELVASLKQDRREYLAGHTGLDPEVIEALG